MAEVTVKTIEGDVMTGATKILFVKGTSAASNDTLTVTGLTTVTGAFLISTTGTVITMTFATNVITMTNSGTLIVSGLAWGT